jgi:hypothetical protein
MNPHLYFRSHGCRSRRIEIVQWREQSQHRSLGASRCATRPRVVAIMILTVLTCCRGDQSMDEMASTHAVVEAVQYDRAAFHHVAPWFYEMEVLVMIEQMVKDHRDRVPREYRTASELLCPWQSIEPAASRPGTNVESFRAWVNCRV